MTGVDENRGWSLLPTGVLWIIAPLWYLLCEAITARAFPGYSYATFYISDLGVPGRATFQGRELASQIPQVMDAGFIGQGLLFFLGLVLAMPALRPGIGRIAFVVVGCLHAAGIVLVGLVPGSPENVANGLIVVHVLGAVAAILGGNCAAILSVGPLRDLGRVRWSGPGLGALGILSGLLLTALVLMPDGVWERGSVYAFLAWELIIGSVICLSSPRLRRGRER
ncbi:MULTISPECIES: DUF998 domain-containing protein [Brevibacterium]|uniref:DUF998 domain-containing protein n=1 Tax=Brevibacterium casei TaxID=33889 RepID=A0A7T4A184_9MICO|nr:DUF998 domain-containing protein [Brevibacterium casei]QQB15468.1 DUF998 domain-containing protein [Brevibacterium casei]